MSEHKFDIVILGAGPGGYVAALRAAQLDLKTAIIEKDAVGGMCLNWGCIPSKTLMASADLYQKIQDAKRFGLTGVNFKDVTPDWDAMNKRAKRVVGRLTKGVQTLLDRNGVTTIMGEGVITDLGKIKVNDDIIEYDNLVIATGSRYPIPDFAKDADNFYTPRTIYQMDDLPKSMTIIGAGVVGIEFALLFSNLGVNVEIVEKSKHFMPYMDDDLIKMMEQTLRRNKVKLHLNAEAVDVSDNGLTIEKDGETETIASDIYLSAVTRQANLSGLDYLLERGLELRRGYIRTDLRCRTTLANVYAVGDVNGRFMLAHVASKEGTTAVETIAGEGRDLVYDLMPYNLYATPEFASVGLTEKQAEAKGFIVETGKFPLTANGKALAENHTEGFIKVVYDKKYGEILGVHIAAYNATDLIGEAVMSMQVESTVWDVAASVHPHPTLSETFMEAAFKGVDRPIHIL